MIAVAGHHTHMIAKRGAVVSLYLTAYLWAQLFVAPMSGAVELFAGNVTRNNYEVPLLMAKQHRRHSNNKKRGGGRNSKGQSGKTASVELDEFMVGTIKLGDGAFNVKFDTGSRGTWVFGKDVNRNYFPDDRRAKSQFHHNFYDENSQTFESYKKDSKQADECIPQRYTESVCMASGKSGYETIQIGDEVELRRTRFQIARQLRGRKNQFTEYDGMLGLEFESPSSDESLSVFSQMAREGLLSKNLFSVYMTSDGTSGEIMFGGWDKERIRGHIDMVDISPPKVDGSTPWEVQVNRLKFGGNSFSRKYSAVVDSAAAIYIPESMLIANNWMETHKHIAEALDKRSLKQGFVPCEARDTLPDLGFGIGDKMYSLNGGDYTASPNGELAYTDMKTGIQWCALLLRSGEEEKITLGAPFFRRYYTIFYYDHFDTGPKIGFGKLDHKDKEEGESKRSAKQRKQEGISDDYFPDFWCGGTLFGGSC